VTYYRYYPKPEGSNPKARKKPVPKAKELNPETGKALRDPRSRIVAGRLILRGADMEDLRRRVGEREAEICQGCQEYAPLYPPDGQIAGEMHHKHGRGMGSSKRDDRAEWMAWLCRACHRAARIEPGGYTLNVEGSE
jgi:hypothetical protein